MKVNEASFFFEEDAFVSRTTHVFVVAVGTQEEISNDKQSKASYYLAKTLHGYDEMVLRSRVA